MSHSVDRKASGPTTAAGATALAAVSRWLTRFRAAKPVHPRGVVLPAVLTRDGSAVPWGVPFLDDRGRDAGVVRLSRSLGLPPPWPDVMGMALRLDGERGPYDLLFDTTGMRPVLRHAPAPRRDPLRAAYGSLFPYDAEGTRVILSAVPGTGSDTHVAFVLRVATVTGPWWPFGTLLVERPDDRHADAPVDFDPVLNHVPGLPQAAPFAALRQPSYAAARRIRHGDA